MSFNNQGKLIVSRLDRIENIEILEEAFNREELKDEYERQMTYCWSSASLNSDNVPETIKLEIIIQEPVENYIIEKIKNEAPNGLMEKIEKGRYHFSMKANDSGELVPWIREYTGYINVIESKKLAERIKKDWKEMLKSYGVV